MLCRNQRSKMNRGATLIGFENILAEDAYRPCWIGMMMTQPPVWANWHPLIGWWCDRI